MAQRYLNQIWRIVERHHSRPTPLLPRISAGIQHGGIGCGRHLEFSLKAIRYWFKYQAYILHAN